MYAKIIGSVIPISIYFVFMYMFIKIGFLVIQALEKYVGT
jgi:hypothetical protein